jgi:indolepyruvate ferredoxin oxidoreductase
VPVSLAGLERAIELNGVAVMRNKQAFAWGRVARAAPDFLPRSARSVPEVETLDEMIARRSAFLAHYQNSAYAKRYEATIARVRRAETALASEALTDAVARSLFRLMAYKDEYEVARLHMESGFLDELRQQFEGDFKIRYHLAPPFLPARKDARGRPHKRSFGPWMQVPMKLLARLRVLRGTRFDLFGYTAERRHERELIAWYEALIEAMLAKLNAQNLPDLLAIARAPMEIRGYGPVKELAIPQVRTEVARLMAHLA